MFHSKTQIFFPLGFILLLVCIHTVATITSISLSPYGVFPREIHGLVGIVTAPLIHGSWEHVLSNITSLCITLFILFTVFPTVSHIVFTMGYILPGIFTWFIGRPAFHIGASGLVYCLLVFLFCIGVYSKKRQLLAISGVVLVLNSGFIWGILPQNNSISWEYHIGGSIIGCILAYVFRNFSFASTKPNEFSSNLSSTADGIEYIYTKKPDSA